MSDPVYETRYLLYVDILGWSEAVAGDAGSRLLGILEQIHAYREAHNERFRHAQLERDGPTEESVPACFAQTYTINANVFGLVPNSNLVLQDNASDNLL